MKYNVSRHAREVLSPIMKMRESMGSDLSSQSTKDDGALSSACKNLEQDIEGLSNDLEDVNSNLDCSKDTAYMTALRTWSNGITV